MNNNKILEMSNNDFIKLIDESKKTNEISKLVNEVVNLKEDTSDNITEKMRLLQARILPRNNSGKYYDELKELQQHYNLEDFKNVNFAAATLYKIPIFQASSLMLNYVIRRRMKQITVVPERWLVLNKVSGLEFAKQLGLKTPEYKLGLKIDKVSRQKGIVIKPNVGSGSKGVYLVMELNKIWSVSDLRELSSWNEMVDDIHKKLAKGFIKEDNFNIERLIYDDPKNYIPAHDLKFYSFYGEIGEILEIRRHPKKELWHWTPDREIFPAVHNYPIEAARGVKEEHIELAREISLRIPVPFIRLDFLYGHDGLYLNEFCTFSGGAGGTTLEPNYPMVDRKFGNMFLKAEARIMEDLLNGKTFKELRDFNKKFDKKIDHILLKSLILERKQSKSEIENGKLVIKYYTSDGKLNYIDEYMGDNQRSGKLKRVYYKGNETPVSYKTYNALGLCESVTKNYSNGNSRRTVFYNITGEKERSVDFYDNGVIKKEYTYNVQSDKNAEYNVYDDIGKLTNHVECYDNRSPMKNYYYNVNTGEIIKYIIYDRKKVIKKLVEYSNGVIIKVTKYNTKSNKTIEIRQYNDSGKIEKLISFNDNGMLMKQVEYNNGVIIKVTKYNTKNNKTVEIRQYNDSGKIEKLISFNDNGILIKQVEYNNGIIIKVTKYNTKNNKTVEIRQYNDSGKVEKLTSFNDNGMLIKQVEYNNGAIIKVTKYNTKNNKTVEIRQYNDSGKVEKLTSFNDNGMLIKQVEYNNGAIFRITTYNDDGSIKRKQNKITIRVVKVIKKLRYNTRAS